MLPLKTPVSLAICGETRPQQMPRGAEGSQQPALPRSDESSSLPHTFSHKIYLKYIPVCVCPVLCSGILNTYLVIIFTALIRATYSAYPILRNLVIIIFDK
jgi:hypothetical protein